MNSYPTLLRRLGLVVDLDPRSGAVHEGRGPAPVGGRDVPGRRARRRADEGRVAAHPHAILGEGVPAGRAPRAAAERPAGRGRPGGPEPAAFRTPAGGCRWLGPEADELRPDAGPPEARRPADRSGHPLREGSGRARAADRRPHARAPRTLRDAEEPVLDQRREEHGRREGVSGAGRSQAAGAVGGGSGPRLPD